jgi:hypothetical protein
VGVQHLWRKGAEAVSERGSHVQDQRVRHLAESNPTRFDKPKPKGLRHAGASQRVKGSPRARREGIKAGLPPTSHWDCMWCRMLCRVNFQNDMYWKDSHDK